MTRGPPEVPTEPAFSHHNHHHDDDVDHDHHHDDDVDHDHDDGVWRIQLRSYGPIAKSSVAITCSSIFKSVLLRSVPCNTHLLSFEDVVIYFINLNSKSQGFYAFMRVLKGFAPNGK